ncbi:hypothetical protein [uncultured Fluviicola sp.]|uniref:hypothetical protein n=1 Tax=uncultured Fluviicola sp. TaxID=463303 RepID=UPI0025FCB2BF|nr:hypothetical protein [uncultured Fluviicola sp.]
MKKSTLNKRSMFGSVHTVLEENQPIWINVPAFATAVAQFENKLTILDTKLSEQSTATTGVTLEKQALIRELFDEMVLAHQALYLFGKDSENTALRERNKVSRSKLNRLTIGKAKVHANDLKNDLLAQGPALDAYGITPAFVSALIAKIDQLPDMIESTRMALLRRKGITKAINEVQSKITEILRDRMDRLIKIFRKDHPDFVLIYQHARTVLPHSSRDRDNGTTA